MRLSINLLLLCCLSGCAVHPYVELSGPGRQVSGKCSKSIVDTLSIDLPEGVHMYVRSAPIDGGVAISTQISLMSVARPASFYLLEDRGALSDGLGYALVERIDFRRFSYGSRHDYAREKNDLGPVTIGGVALPAINLHVDTDTINVDYVARASFLTGEIRLPDMLINGKRVGVPPIKMEKKAGVVLAGCH